MATSTEIFNTIKEFSRALINLTRADANAMDTQVNTINQGYNGLYASDLTASLENVLDGYANVLTNSFKNGLIALIDDLAQSTDIDLAIDGESASRTLELINKWLYDNSVAVLEQPHTLTVSAITGLGTGLVLTNYTNKYNAKIGNLFNNKILLECVNDSMMSRRSGAELFNIIPENEGSNDILRYGTSEFGTKRTFTSVNPITENYLPNSFWSGITYDSGTLIVSDMKSWTFTTGTIADVKANTTLVFRDSDQSLEVINTAGGAKTVKISCEITKQMSDLLPYFGWLAYGNKTDGGTTDITLQIGSKSTTVAIPDVSGVEAALAYLQWKTDADSYLTNFKDTITGVDDKITASIEVEFPALSAINSTVRLYGAFFGAGGFIGNLPILITAGQINWALGDYFTITSAYTLGTGMITQMFREQLKLDIHQKPNPTAGYTIITDPA